MIEKLRDNQRARVGVLAVLAVAVAVIAFLLVSGGDDNDSSGGGATGPTLASGDELADLAKDAGHTVYWAGEQPNTRTEFEETSDGNVFIRYLPEDGDPASERDSALTIGSYPVGDAIAGLEVVAERPGANTYELHSAPGAIVVNNDNRPSSVYVAFPDSAVQIEVYDPDPAKALQIVLEGHLEPLD